MNFKIKSKLSSFLNIPLLAILLSSILFSCSKSSKDNCDVSDKTVPSSEILQLDDYISSNNIIAQKDAKGFYYSINNAGNTKKPNACSNVTVDYVGKLSNGQIFDQNKNISFNLQGLITGWQLAMPLIGEQGEITIYLPPSLGYGIKGNGAVPSNAITIFTITLLKVNN